MNILAIETTGATASVALLTGENKIYRASSDEEMNHLSGLIPMTEKVLKDASVSKNELTHTAVSIGPGSFTGIRIGIATAKTLAQALDLPMLSVPTLESFVCVYEGSACTAYTGDGRSRLVCPMFDARRRQVYGGGFCTPSLENIREIVKSDAYDVDKFIIMALEAAKAENISEVIFFGDGADKYPDAVEAAVKAAASADFKLSDGTDIKVLIADSEIRYQDAVNIARMAADMVACEKVCTYNEVHPMYLRKAEAERKLAAKQLGKKNKDKEPQVMVELPPADELINYRQADTADCDRLAELDKISFSRAWSVKAFEDDFTGSREAVYFAAENSKGEIIGFAGMVYLLGEGEVNRVAVHPLYRGRGIADRMMTLLMEEAQRREITAVTLEVREANRSAIALYKNHGFDVEGKRSGYYAETGENALIMWRRKS